ncbi:hypothetical protein F53441_11502 [Fusarium austroafricanum]|uniref:Uncharacterized protein n=1 Tax=Fusarium austroafricanum TaxID=2364996 RepID=A0A8H4NS53_9HYPO|nr:hypothetical protein F53441_11502 [Fusarium austroafricanum]
MSRDKLSVWRESVMEEHDAKSETEESVSQLPMRPKTPNNTGTLRTAEGKGKSPAQDRRRVSWKPEGDLVEVKTFCEDTPVKAPFSCSWGNQIGSGSRSTESPEPKTDHRTEDKKPEIPEAKITHTYHEALQVAWSSPIQLETARWRISVENEIQEKQLRGHDGESFRIWKAERLLEEKPDLFHYIQEENEFLKRVGPRTHPRKDPGQEEVETTHVKNAEPSVPEPQSVEEDSPDLPKMPENYPNKYLVAWTKAIEVEIERQELGKDDQDAFWAERKKELKSVNRELYLVMKKHFKYLERYRIWYVAHYFPKRPEMEVEMRKRSRLRLQQRGERSSSKTSETFPTRWYRRLREEGEIQGLDEEHQKRWREVREAELKAKMPALWRQLKEGREGKSDTEG